MVRVTDKRVAIDVLDTMEAERIFLMWFLGSVSLTSDKAGTSASTFAAWAWTGVAVTVANVSSLLSVDRGPMSRPKLECARVSGEEGMCVCVVRTCDKEPSRAPQWASDVVGRGRREGVELEPASAPAGNDDMHLEEGGEEGGSLSVAVVMLVLVRVLDDDEEVEVEVETFLLSALI